MTDSYILGLNGWHDSSHDASAVLLKCNSSGVEIVAAAEEERFTRNLHAYDSLPANAAQFCLRKAGINAEDLDKVAFAWNMPKVYSDHSVQFSHTNKDILKIIFNRDLIKDLKIEFIDHHYSHALSAFGPSGFERATVLVVDGQGETESTSVWTASGNNLRQVASLDIGSSLGYFYESLTEFVGFRTHHAGKTMGLAPYGNAHSFSEQLHSLFSLNGLSLNLSPKPKVQFGVTSGSKVHLDEQSQMRDFWFSQFKQLTKNNPSDKTQVYSFRDFPSTYLDLAAAGQSVLESMVSGLARNAISLTQESNLCLAGGVALNCVANGKIYNTITDKIFVQPAANDAGAALGAALAVAKNEGYRVFKLNSSPYLGEEFAQDDVQSAIVASGIKYERVDDATQRISQLIGAGSVVGLFQGRFELGPRALGNRSFIADPRSRNMWDYINAQIKQREEGRPLAATILHEDSERFFGKSIEGFNMTITHTLIDETLGAARHVDGTIRPQILRRDENPLFYNQIKEIGARIGVNAVLNTSLNFKEPIVRTPSEALELFKKTGVDAIVFNNTYITLRNNND